MKAMDTSWKTFLLRALVLGAVIFVAVRTAVARPGVPGGAARSFVTIAGTITGTGASGALTAEFRFHRPGAMPRCAPQVMITNRDPATGDFSVEVPLDQSGRVCPDDLFDGSDVQVDVVVNGEAVATNAAINPVPYAIHADLAVNAVNATNASQYGTPDCPIGYTRAMDPTFTGDMRLCQRRRADASVYDEIVRVGTGTTAFWIDRYEAMVWSNADGSGTQYGTETDDYPSTFPDNGQWTAPLYSVSHAYDAARPGAARPSGSMTWFQANELCRLSGGRLPTGSEWLAAARGTPDPGASNGTGGLCNTMSSGPRSNGADTVCRSAWGAQAMIGNLQEWVDEWYATGGGGGGSANPWPAGFNGDGTENVGSSAITAPSGFSPGAPAAQCRGGHWGGGARAGIFELTLNLAPSVANVRVGFRCVRTR